MNYAHIYNTPGRKFRLFITTGPALSDGVVSEQIFDSKAEAKKVAKAAGAQAWNY